MIEPIKVESVPGRLNDDLANVFKAFRVVGDHFGGALGRLPARPAPTIRRWLDRKGAALRKGKRHKPSMLRY